MFCLEIYVAISTQIPFDRRRIATNEPFEKENFSFRELSLLFIERVCVRSFVCTLDSIVVALNEQDVCVSGKSTWMDMLAIVAHTFFLR